MPQLSCSLLQVVDIFSNSDIDISLVMQLLVHSQGLAEDIVACETNNFHSVRAQECKRVIDFQSLPIWTALGFFLSKYVAGWEGTRKAA
jgi:hypothetical protein